jgi:hypothetical protein
MMTMTFIYSLICKGAKVTKVSNRGFQLKCIS